MPAVKSSYAVFFKPSFLFLFPACTVVTGKGRKGWKDWEAKGRKEEMSFPRMSWSEPAVLAVTTLGLQGP